MKRLNALKSTVSAIALMATGLFSTGCAVVGPSYQAPSVNPQEVARVQVPAGRPVEYNRTDAQNHALLGATFAKVHQAAQPICAQAQVDCSRFTVAYDPRPVINAFASNGSQITVFAGLMRYTNEPQLAAVLAHEYAHHINRDNVNTQTRATGGAVLGSILGGLAAQAMGTNPQQGAEIGARMGMGTAVVAFSKGQEARADYVGAYILARAGYNLQEAGQMWNTMAQLSGGGNKPSGMFATHPSSAERLVAWQHTIREVEASPNKLPRLKPSN